MSARMLRTEVADTFIPSLVHSPQIAGNPARVLACHRSTSSTSAGFEASLDTELTRVSPSPCTSSDASANSVVGVTRTLTSAPEATIRPIGQARRSWVRSEGGQPGVQHCDWWAGRDLTSLSSGLGPRLNQPKERVVREGTRG